MRLTGSKADLAKAVPALGYRLDRGVKADTAVQQVAGNATPLMSYTIVYALSNVALPLLGPIAVAMTSALN
ncbi:hypothetical protein [Nocardia sp. NBC_00511]|uniref:hypothetical protein n=1 Tax=Nocardia sp. NBC_00511 TaxID=2903591 RepID=UPI0030E3F3F1